MTPEQWTEARRLYEVEGLSFRDIQIKFDNIVSHAHIGRRAKAEEWIKAIQNEARAAEILAEFEKVAKKQGVVLFGDAEVEDRSRVIREAQHRAFLDVFRDRVLIPALSEATLNSAIRARTLSAAVKDYLAMDRDAWQMNEKPTVPLSESIGVGLVAPRQYESVEEWEAAAHNEGQAPVGTQTETDYLD